MIIGNKNNTPNRFFTHNKGFEFAYALKDINDNELINELTEILKQQVDSARSLLDILKDKNQVKKFNTIVEIKKYNIN